MSEDNKIIDPIHALIEQVAMQDQKKDEVLAKELVIRDRKADSTLQKIRDNDKNENLAKKINYGTLAEKDIADMQQENTDYMMSARNKMNFINKDLGKCMPFFRKNLILIGAWSGDGKSTAVANVIRGIIGNVNPKTGKKRRILVLTNEEKSEDVYNRITCLLKGWHYVDHDKFTDEQLATFNEYIKLLSKDGMVTVIDNVFGGAVGTTTTLEGVCQIFDNLLANKEYYDCILIDYYQNVTESRKNITLGQYEVQEALARKLDIYKNIYPAPIILLAQVKKAEVENATPFKMRIEGRKSIYNVCTMAMEMIAHKDLLKTEWIIHKSRFAEAIGKSIDTGYDHGRFVSYSEEFRNKVAEMRAAIERKELDKTMHHLEAPKEEKPTEDLKNTGENE